MKPQYITELPLGYDEQTRLMLTTTNEIAAYHPVMPPIIYDESVMRWLPIMDSKPREKK